MNLREGAVPAWSWGGEPAGEALDLAAGRNRTIEPQPAGPPALRVAATPDLVPPVSVVSGGEEGGAPRLCGPSSRRCYVLDADASVWRRTDGQERAITHMWPPAPWDCLAAPLGRLEAACEWLDERVGPLWLDAVIGGLAMCWLSVLAVAILQ